LNSREGVFRTETKNKNIQIDEKLAQELTTQAKEAMKNAYTPYSNFQVGAAVLAQDGKVYTGCNIENASYGATICAERTAILKAISQGNRKIYAVAITSSSHKHTPPCGMCLQVMCEFMDNEGVIILSEDVSDVMKCTMYSLADFLPNRFYKDSMDIK